MEINTTEVQPVRYTIAREKRLAALHQALASEMGQAQYDSEPELELALQTALWHLGVCVEVAAALTTATRDLR